MANSPKKPRGGFKGGIKVPLVFSFVVGIIAFVVATMVSTGGLNNPDHPLRVDIGLIAFGIAFAATLVVVALLQLTGRENPDHLSQGSGMNRWPFIIQIAIATIITFSVSDTKPSGTFDDPPTQAHLSSRLSR